MNGPRVTLRENVVFGHAGGRELRADVFIPPGLEPGQRVPAVVLLHGGAWIVGDPRQLRGYGFLLGREGLVCIAPEYRLAKSADPSTRWPAQLHDVKAAVRWLRANAEEFHVDPDRIVASGNSAGSHLALMLAATGDIAELEGESGSAGFSSALQGVVSLYGISRVAKGSDMLADAVDKLIGRDSPASVFASASPIGLVGTHWPPTVLMHSNLDDLVPVRQTIDLYEALRAVGVSCELHLYDAQPHAFDAEPRLGREAASLILSFVRRYLPDPAPATEAT
jgi:acetyl esterase/lipase